MFVSKVLVSLKMQFKIYLRNIYSLALIGSLPFAIFLTLYLITNSDYVRPVILLESGGQKEIILPVKEARSVPMGMVGVAFITAATAMNSVMQSSFLDRRLILCGYNMWELILSRILILSGVVLFASITSLVFMIGFIQPNNIAFAFLAMFLAGVIAVNIGMLIGSVVKQALDGFLIIIGIFGIQMAVLENNIEKFFPLYFPKQLLLIAFFSQNPDWMQILGISISLIVLLIIPAIVLYYNRTKTIKVVRQISR